MSDTKPTDEMVTVLVIDDGNPQGGNVYYEDLQRAMDHIQFHIEALFDKPMAGENISPIVRVECVSRAFLDGLEEADWL